MIECRAEKAFPGYLFGYQYPTLVFSFAATEPKRDAATLVAVGTALDANVLIDSRIMIARSHAESPADPFVLYLTLYDTLVETCHMPPMERHMMTPGSPQSGEAGARTTVFAECPDLSFAAGVIGAIGGLCSAAAAGEAGEALEQRCETTLARLRSHPAALNLRRNSLHLAVAARKMRLPVVKLPRGLMQYGWGRRSTLAVSSMTDRTSLVSSQIAKDKPLARSLLLAARLPATDQRVVQDLENTRRAAQEIGFPVVVKPRSLDGGKGVTTNIRDEATLEKAFAKAKALSQSVLVEQQVFGGEYRLLVVHGRLLAIHERVPAMIEGNGTDSLEVLVEAENARRKEREREGERIVRLLIDEESHECLAGQGMTMASVPDAGQVVRLQTVPKMATGGTTRDVDPSEFHPANIEAALRAARFARLDIAGVDFITPDPSRHWRETACAFTEVNAVPEINVLESFDVFSVVLEELLPEGGRIPAVLLIDDEGDTQFAAAIARHSGCGEGELGLLATSASLSDRLEAEVPDVAAGDGQAVLRDPRVGSIVAVQSLQDILGNGFALDRFDLIAIRSLASPGDARQLTNEPFLPMFRDCPVVALESVARAAPLEPIAKGGMHVAQGEEELVSAIAKVLKGGD